MVVVTGESVMSSDLDISRGNLEGVPSILTSDMSEDVVNRDKKNYVIKEKLTYTK